jgi:hypothetical protein
MGVAEPKFSWGQGDTRRKCILKTIFTHIQYILNAGYWYTGGSTTTFLCWVIILDYICRPLVRSKAALHGYMYILIALARLRQEKRVYISISAAKVKSQISYLPWLSLSLICNKLFVTLSEAHGTATELGPISRYFSLVCISGQHVHTYYIPSRLHTMY